MRTFDIKEVGQIANILQAAEIVIDGNFTEEGQTEAILYEKKLRIIIKPVTVAPLGMYSVTFDIMELRTDSPTFPLKDDTPSAYNTVKIFGFPKDDGSTSVDYYQRYVDWRGIPSTVNLDVLLQMLRDLQAS